MDFQNMPPPLTLLIHVLYKYLLRASRCSFGFFAAELVAGEGPRGPAGASSAGGRFDPNLW